MTSVGLVTSNKQVITNYSVWKVTASLITNYVFKSVSTLTTWTTDSTVRSSSICSTIYPAISFLSPPSDTFCTAIVKSRFARLTGVAAVSSFAVHGSLKSLRASCASVVTCASEREADSAFSLGYNLHITVMFLSIQWSNGNISV